MPVSVQVEDRLSDLLYPGQPLRFDCLRDMRDSDVNRFRMNMRRLRRRIPGWKKFESKHRLPEALPGYMQRMPVRHVQLFIVDGCGIAVFRIATSQVLFCSLD